MGAAAATPTTARNAANVDKQSLIHTKMNEGNNVPIGPERYWDTTYTESISWITKIF
jgi:hypothetical protein